MIREKKVINHALNHRAAPFAIGGGMLVGVGLILMGSLLGDNVSVILGFCVPGAAISFGAFTAGLMKVDHFVRKRRLQDISKPKAFYLPIDPKDSAIIERQNPDLRKIPQQCFSAEVAIRSTINISPPTYSFSDHRYYNDSQL